MAFPRSWAGYDEITLTNPASALTDFTYVIGLDNLSAAFRARLRDGGADLVVTTDSNVQIPAYCHRWNGSSGLAVFKFSPSDSGTQKIRLWAGGFGPQPVVGGTYGRNACFASHVKGFWPDGGGNDLTSNANHFTGSPAVGSTAGPINGSLTTAYDGTQGATATASVPTDYPITMIQWFVVNSVTGTHQKLAVRSVDGSNYFQLSQSAADLQAIARDSAASTASVSTISASVGALGSARFTSATSRTAILNTTAGTPNTTSRTPTGLEQIRIGRFLGSGSNGHNGLLGLTWLHNADVGADWISYAQSMLAAADQGDIYTYGGWTDYSLSDGRRPIRESIRQPIRESIRG